MESSKAEFMAKKGVESEKVRTLSEMDASGSAGGDVKRVVCSNKSGNPDWVGKSRLSREMSNESGNPDWVGIYRLSRCIPTESGLFHSEKIFSEKIEKGRSERSTTKASLELACSTLALTSFLAPFLQWISAGRGALLSHPARLIFALRWLRWLRRLIFSVPYKFRRCFRSAMRW